MQLVQCVDVGGDSVADTEFLGSQHSFLSGRCDNFLESSVDNINLIYS